MGSIEPGPDLAAAIPGFDRLVTKVWSRYKKASPDERLLIGISGIPGAGKSTLSLALERALNSLHRVEQPTSQNIAVAVPMDGFHYTRAHLAQMPDPENAIHRRGAAFTFDAEGFCALVRALRDPVDSKTVHAPSFDHAVKDPVADAIEISPSLRIVILEGNYVSLDIEPWSSAARLLDERWFVSIDRKVARDRLATRHVASGIVSDLEAAYARVDSTDSLNGDEILAKLLDVDEVIRC